MKNLKTLAALMVASMSLLVAPVATASDNVTCPSNLGEMAKPVQTGSLGISEPDSKAYTLTTGFDDGHRVLVSGPVEWRVLSQDGANCHTERGFSSTDAFVTLDGDKTYYIEVRLIEEDTAAAFSIAIQNQP